MDTASLQLGGCKASLQAASPAGPLREPPPPPERPPRPGPGTIAASSAVNQVCRRRPDSPAQPQRPPRREAVVSTVGCWRAVAGPGLCGADSRLGPRRRRQLKLRRRPVLDGLSHRDWHTLPVVVVPVTVTATTVT